MRPRQLLIFAFLTGWVIFGLNTLAGKFYWYSGVWWFDMPMHFLGGLFVGLLVLFYTKRSINDAVFMQGRDIALTLFLVLIVAFGWEVLEYILFRLGGDNFSFLDATSDLAFGLAGGSLATLIHISFRNRV